MLLRPLMALSVVATLLTGCDKVPDLTAYLPTSLLPAMQWDSRPEAATWTSRTLTAVAAHDSELASTIPKDIAAFCPGYAKAPLGQRRAFWAGLLSATAKHESGNNPKAAGGGGRYIGLMQISPRTAQHYGCKAESGTALKDGAANLECAVRIIAPNIGADGMVAGNGNRGIARDWGPFKKDSTRAEIAAWTSSQSYCRA